MGFLTSSTSVCSSSSASPQSCRLFSMLRHISSFMCISVSACDWHPCSVRDNDLRLSSRLLTSLLRARTEESTLAVVSTTSYSHIEICRQCDELALSLPGVALGLPWSNSIDRQTYLGRSARNRYRRDGDGDGIHLDEQSRRRVGHSLGQKCALVESVEADTARLTTEMPPERLNWPRQARASPRSNSVKSPVRFLRVLVLPHFPPKLKASV